MAQAISSATSRTFKCFGTRITMRRARTIVTGWWSSIWMPAIYVSKRTRSTSCFPSVPSSTSGASKVNEKGLVRDAAGPQARRNSDVDDRMYCQRGGTPEHARDFELFTPRTLSALLASAEHLKPVEELQFSVGNSTLRTSMPLEKAIHDGLAGHVDYPHIVLEHAGRQFTSISVFLRRTE